MKKFIAIPLLVLYLTAVSGMMVQLHFCGSELSSWNVNNAKNSCCCSENPLQVKDRTWTGNDIGAKSDDCCSDKTITLKIAQDQNKTTGVQLQLGNLQMAVLPNPAVPQFAFLTTLVTKSVYRSNAPPGCWQNIPLYKLHSRFTYYG